MVERFEFNVVYSGIGEEAFALLWEPKAVRRGSDASYQHLMEEAPDATLDGLRELLSEDRHEGPQIVALFSPEPTDDLAMKQVAVTHFDWIDGKVAPLAPLESGALSDMMRVDGRRLSTSDDSASSVHITHILDEVDLEMFLQDKEALGRKRRGTFHNF